VIDGVGVLRRLAGMGPGRSCPAFVLTSHISGPQAAEARAAGADAVFTKPVQVAALAAAFRARRGNEGLSSPNGNLAEDAAEPLVDPETFAGVAGLARLSEATRFVAEFEATMREDISIIGAADAKDLAQARRQAHRSLGLCQVMGALSLARQLRTIEEGAARGDLRAVQALVPGMLPLLEATLADMRAALGAREPDAAV
jgi:CheY-like chemotaxis protein